LLLATGQAQGRGVQPVLDLIPEDGQLQGLLNPLSQDCLVTDAAHPGAISDIVKDRHRQRHRLLENHADPAAQICDNHVLRVDVLSIDQDLSFCPGIRHQIAETVHRPQQGRGATVGRAKQRENLIRMDIHVDGLDGLMLAIVEAEITDRDFRLLGHIAPVSGFWPQID